MKETFVLDTSALLAFIDGEDGADDVEKVLRSAMRSPGLAAISSMTLAEVYYITMQEQGESIAKATLAHVKALGLDIVYPDEQLTLFAARIKAAHRLSLADAFVAATAQFRAAVLVHKDPEFDPLSTDLKMLRLPNKRRS